MRRQQVILLVAGLAVVAALPVQDSVASTQQDDLMKIFLSANPEENDLFIEDSDKPSASPTESGDQESHKVVEAQPQEQTQPRDSPQETQSQDLPEEQKQTEPQSPPQEQTQQQPQVHDVETAQDSSLPDGTEDESPAEESILDTMEGKPEPQLILDPQEDFPIGPGDLDEDEVTYFDPETGGLSTEQDDDYVVFHVKEETPSQDREGTITYELLVEKDPFDQEAGPLLFNPELPSDPQMDSVPYESEPHMQPFSVQLQPQMDPFSYDSEVPFSQEEPLSSDPQTESDYEQLPLEIMDRPDAEYDYEFPAEAYQPKHEENMSLEPESAPAEDSYYSDHVDVPMDLLSWLVPDFFDEEPTDYEESFYDSSYYDQGPVIKDYPPPNIPEVLFEPQVSDFATWEEPSSEVNDATKVLDGSLLGSGGDVVVEEAVPLSMTDFNVEEDTDDVKDTYDVEENTYDVEEDTHDVEEDTDDVEDTYDVEEDTHGVEEDTDDVSLVDFFIPTYDEQMYSSAPQEYSSNATPEDKDEFLSPDEETFSVDDGLIHVEPFLKTDLVGLEQDQMDTMLFGEVLPDNNPSEDGSYIASWSTESDRADQRDLPDEAITILETQPIHIHDMETDISYPSLLEILEKHTAEEGPAEPWGNAKSLMIDFAPEADTMLDDSMPMERETLSEGHDDDAKEIIMINDPRENFGNFHTIPLAGGSHSDLGQPKPMGWYPENHHQQPYWAPFRSSDQPIPKVYYSDDEVPRKTFPGFFGHMNDLTFPSPMSNRPHETAVTRDPFSFMNEIPGDGMPHQFLASISTLGQHKFRGLSSPFSARNYPDKFTTPRLSFRDLMQSLNPSHYNTINVNDIERQSPYLHYPQSYNPFLQYNGFPKQYSPPMPYSSLFDSFQDNDYLVDGNYYANRLERLSSYGPNNMPSGIFREDTKPEMYYRGPQRYYEDYTTDLPFMSSPSYRSPRSHFPIFERPHYESNSPSFNRPHFSQNRYYSTGPYHPTPIYSRYAPTFY